MENSSELIIRKNKKRGPKPKLSMAKTINTLNSFVGELELKKNYEILEKNYNSKLQLIEQLQNTIYTMKKQGLINFEELYNNSQKELTELKNSSELIIRKNPASKVELPVDYRYQRERYIQEIPFGMGYPNYFPRYY